MDWTREIEFVRSLSYCRYSLRRRASYGSRVASSAPPGDNGNGGGDIGSGDPVTAENVGEFVDALDQTIAAAIEGVLADPTLFEAKRREPGVAKIGPNRAEVGGCAVGFLRTDCVSDRSGPRGSNSR